VRIGDGCENLSFFQVGGSFREDASAAYYEHHGTSPPTPTPEDYGDYDYDYETDDYYDPPDRYEAVMDILDWAVDAGVGDEIPPSESFEPLADYYGRLLVKSSHASYDESFRCSLEYVRAMRARERAKRSERGGAPLRQKRGAKKVAECYRGGAPLRRKWGRECYRRGAPLRHKRGARRCYYFCPVARVVVPELGRGNHGSLFFAH
jgi:hypothetical protein